MRFQARLASLVLLGCLACSRGADKEPPPEADDPAAAGAGDQPAEQEEPRDERPAGPTGSIAGVVSFLGDAPEMPKLQRGADPFCARVEMHAETVIVKDGKLRDVHVRIARGGAPSWVPSDPVVVDQTDCMYRPRVQGGVVGQTLEIRNSDQTIHNVHLRALKLEARQGHQTIFNRAQPKGVPPIQATVVDEDAIKLKCDQHGWMQAYVVVSDHPYFDTTGDDGTFLLEEVPVGSYEIEAWHPLYGRKSAQVEVAEGERAEASFVYDGEMDGPPSH